MSLWSNTDNLAGAPAWLTPTVTFTGGSAAGQVGTNKLILGANPFASGDPVTYSQGSGSAISNLTDGAVLFVRVLNNSEIELYATKAQATGTATTGRKAFAADSGNANTYSLQKTPDNLFLISPEEAALQNNRDRGMGTPGWYEFSAGTGNRAGRFDAELLCAFGGAVTGDAGITAGGDEDLTVFDRSISITSVTMPAVDVANNATAVATVVAAFTPNATGAAYRWEHWDGSAWDDTFTVNDGSEDAAVLNVASGDAEYGAGEQFRVKVFATDARTETSDVVTITQSS